MHPVLFRLPEFPAWIGALALLLLGGVFAYYARKDPADKGSWWLAAACAVGAIWLVAAMGFTTRVERWPIRLFGILFVAGFLLAAKVFSARNERLGILGKDESFDLALYVLLAGIAGARAFHVLQHTDDFAGRPLKMIAITDGGLVWYGGALASTLYAWHWLSKRGKDLWTVTDSGALAVPLGHAVGRIGCFMAGCDYGKVVEGGRDAVPWAVRFPDDPETLVPRDLRTDPDTLQPVYLHPAQLYLVLFNLVTFALLFWVDRKVKKGAFPGRIAALYFISYAVGRGVVEQWRGDADRGLYFDGAVSFSQLVSAVVLVAGILMYRGLRARARARHQLA